MKRSVNQIDLKGLTPLEVFLSFPGDVNNLAFLSSDATQDSRWSIICWNPSESISYDGGDKSFSEKLNELLASRKVDYDGELPFVGGAIGSIDYEYGYELLGIPFENDGRKLIEFHFYDRGLIFDHKKSQWWQLGDDKMDDLPGSRVVSDTKLKLKASWSFDEYRKKFDELKENIRVGEIYQACLTFPFFGPEVENSRDLFAQLLRISPAPMAAYLENIGRQILSLSPERFVEWDGEKIETKPIKGTRPRGKNDAEDKKMLADILKNEKERAELNMITDLLRNDLSKVSKPGSVKVLEHRAIQKLPSVWHTYSQIVAETKDDIRSWDIIEAMFPGGSISGCPKKRAVEILKDLESGPRGIYTGSIGYISDHGAMDFNIAIRTLEQRDGKIPALRGSFGGGIVYDSVAEAEYQECLDKANPFLNL